MKTEAVRPSDVSVIIYYATFGTSTVMINDDSLWDITFSWLVDPEVEGPAILPNIFYIKQE